MFKKVLYNTGWQILGKTVTALSTLLITLLIGRSLGPSVFGEFTKIFVFVGYFYTFADFGLNSIFVKLAQKESAGKFFEVLLGLRIVIALLLWLAAIVVTFFLPYNAQAATGFSPLVKTGLVIASLTIITQALFTTANAVFQKNLRYDLSAIATITGSITMVAITFILFSTTRSILPYIFIYIAGGIVFVLASYFLIWSKFKQNLTPSFQVSKSKELISLSWPIGVALVLNLLYFRIDVFILASFRQSAEVGIYGLGYQFFQAALAVPIFFTNALYPVLVKIYKENLEKFKKTVRSWLVYLVGFSLILAIILYIASYLIPIIYDFRFLGSATTLRILALGLPFFFITALFWHLFIIYEKQRFLIYIYGVGAVFNLIINLIFIPIYGFVAAAATTVISEALITILLFLGIRKFKI